MVCDFSEGLPGVVIHENGGRQLVHAACPLATDLGVAPGMPLNAAHVLCRNLVVRMRDPLGEYRRLKRDSEALQRFTPVVSLGFWETASAAIRGRRNPRRVVSGPDDNADTLLMEVSGSLRLFGGLEPLLAGVRALFAGHPSRAANTGPADAFQQPLLAVAPTPAAALLLARNGRESVIRDPADLRSGLGELAVAGADIDARLAADLGRCGLGTLRDLWRLPAADLGRRFGSALPDYLARLTGEHPEAMVRREIAPRFRRRMTLPADTRDSGMILLAAEKLLAVACRFLARHAAAAEEMIFDLWHVDRGRGERGRTRLAITAARAGRHPGHFLPQLETRLEALGRSAERARPGRGKRAGGVIAMPAAVEAVSIRVDRVLPCVRDSQDLFQRRQDDQPDWDGLMDLLTARLGREGVYRLAPAADHRPERAARIRRAVAMPAGAARTGAAAEALSRDDGMTACLLALPPRPLWLLPRPRPLDGSDLSRVASASTDENERIEAGWWDRADVRRDYRVAPLGFAGGESHGGGLGDGLGDGLDGGAARGRPDEWIAMGWIYRDHASCPGPHQAGPRQAGPRQAGPCQAGSSPTGNYYLHGLFG